MRGTESLPPAHWLAACAGFLPGLLPAAAAALLAPVLQPGIPLALWLLAQPLFAAAAVRALGYQFEPTLARSAWRRGVPALLLWCGAAVAVVAIAGWPFWRVLDTAALGWVLAASAALTLAWLLLWRAWPAPTLPYLWQAAPERGPFWPLGAALGSVAFGRRILQRGDAGTLRGSLAAVGGVLLLAAPAALTVLAVRGSGLDLRAGWLALLALAPLVHLLLIAATARALHGQQRARASRSQVEATPVTAGEPASAPAAVPSDPVEALHQWARSGRIDEALALIEAGVDVHALPGARARDQRTLAMLAAVQSDLRLLRTLIARGVDVNRRHAGLTPLLAATRDSYHGRPEAVLTLLANGADPRARDADGNTALHHAARSCDAGVAAQLIDAGAELEALNRDGHGPLGAACASGNWRLARFLLDRGARAEPAKGQPPLLAAASGEDDAAGVTLLLKHKARVDTRGRFERSALMAACLAGNVEIVQALLNAGADVDARDAHGVTPLMEAARAGANAVLRVLAPRAPAADARDAAGRDALLIACGSAKANGESVSLLRMLGCEATTTDGEGRSPLQLAIAGGRWSLVAALDPEYPLPASVTARLDAERTDLPPTELLRRALADGDLPRAESALALGGGIATVQRNAVFEQLAIGDDPAPCDTLRWLARRGVEADRHDQGDTLLFRLLRHGGAAGSALSVLLERGCTAAGRGGLARYLDACIHGEHSARGHESLALALLERGADPFGADPIGADPFGADPHATDPCGSDAVAVGSDGVDAPGSAPRDVDLTGTPSRAGASSTPAAVPTDAGNATARIGDAPLFGAVRLGWPRLAQWLLAAGLDPHVRDARGNTPLHLACQLGLEPLVRELVRHGADATLRAPDGQTPQGLALASGRRDLSRWLCWNGWKPPARTLRATDVVAAAQTGDVEAVERLVALGLPLDALDAQGCTPLLRACGGGHGVLVAWLLERGAEADHAAATGATCLSVAVSMDHAGIAALLLEHGAAVDRRLPGGVTPLLVAAALGRPELVALLIGRGATLNLRDEQGNTALLAAAHFAFGAHTRGAAQPLLERLLAAGADVDARNRLGQSALLLLLGARAEAGATPDEDALLPLLELLLAHGAELAVQEQQRGFGPLHLAALHGLGRCVSRLLAAGADANQRDALNRTPQEIALMRGFVDIAQSFGPAQPAPSIARFLRPPA